jgi:uncharacterized protein YraI
MKVMRGRARIVAVAGLVVAAAVTTVLAVVGGTAQAAEGGTCTETVNVREQPSLDAPVIGTCEAGTAVSIDDRRDNFVHLTSPAGWASADFVTTTSSAETSSTDQPSSASASPQGTPTPTTSPDDLARAVPAEQTPASAQADAPTE